MPRRKLSKIADSTFSFRLNSDDRKKIESKIDQVRDRLNKEVSEEEYKITKNEIVLTAIKIGLKTIRIEDLPKRHKKTTTS